MPDCISLKVDGTKVHVQKRLLLSNLKETYQLFVERHPDKKIGFSTFDMHPRECIIAGASGTHSVHVCVCTIHQNVKLMMVGSKMEDVTMVDGSEISLKHYSQALSAIRCKQFLPDCALGICNSCPGTDKLKENLLEYFDANEFDEIQYKQWTTTDRSQLETISQSTEEFVETFIEKLQVLSRHDFIAKEQSNYLKDRNAAFNEGEDLVLGDFSENYTFIIQDAIQGYH